MSGYYKAESKPIRFRLPVRMAQPLGAGDVIARMTRAMGLQQCEPCRRRQDAMNRWLQFIGRR